MSCRETLNKMRNGIINNNFNIQQLITGVNVINCYISNNYNC